MPAPDVVVTAVHGSLMRISLSKAAPLLFCSGACALIYQVAWLRELRLVFGGSTAASAAVLAIFMGGLGGGGLLFGRRADARRDAILLYGNLELGVAVTAALTPSLIVGVRFLYAALGGTVSMGLGGGTVVRLLLSAIVLLPPTVLMGGTLPAAAKAVETEDDAGRTNLAVLYGVNTLGAVTGAVASTFLLLEVFGVDFTLWMACAVNALVGMAARVVPRHSPPLRERGEHAGERVGDLVSPSPSLAEEGSGRFVLAASGLVGFAFLLMELVWYRMLGPILGGTTYTFGLILALALLGVGAGGAAYAALGRRRPATFAGLALTCALEALFLAVPLAFGDRLALLALVLRPLGAVSFTGAVFGWSLVASIVVLPAAFVSGVQFPLLLALLGRGARDVGRHVGLAYAWNTAGAIGGSLAGGFGLLPALSAPGAWRGVVLLLGVLAAGAAWLSFRHEQARVRAAVPVAAAMLAALLLRADGPTAAWRHSGIGAGRASLRTAGMSANLVEDFCRAQRRSVRWEADGVESSVAVADSDGVTFIVNGKADGHAVIDAGTQVMSGLIGAAMHPSPKRAMVVGLGTGSTAGWLGAVPSLERVDVVELEPAIVRVARDAALVNHAVLDDPKVRILFGDAREVVLVSRERYDLVFSEPSNPYRAGVAGLFTRDFYRSAAERLAPGGLFLQWLQAYEVDAQTVRTAYATLVSVFPEVTTWVTASGDMVLMASREPLRVDAPLLRARLAEEPFRTAMEKVWRAAGLEGLLAHHAASSALAREIARQEGPALNTDDRNMLEFGFARGMGRDTSFSELDVSTLARLRHEDRPEIAGGPVDWEAVEEQRAAWRTITGQPPAGSPSATPDGRKRLEAYASFGAHDPAGVLAAWGAQPRRPSGALELSMIAEALADQGSDDALPVLDELRAFEPTEAEALLARLRHRQGKRAEAAGALEAAFVSFRADPWPRRSVMRHALTEVTLEVAREPALGRRLFDVLGEPFALRLLEDDRRETRLKLAARVDLEQLCTKAVADLEPEVPWQREILLLRHACYAAVGSPKVTAAEADIAAFVHAEGSSFDEGLVPVAK